MEVVPMDESYKAAPKKYLVPVVFDKNNIPINNSKITF